MDRKRLKAVYEKTGGRCWYCGIHIEPLGDWQVEHQHPRAKGGSDETENLVPACRGCNIKKGNRTVDEYRRSLISKLENKITEAFEFARELEGYVSWDRTSSPMSAGGFLPPEWLLKIGDALHDVACDAISQRALFYGEHLDPVSAALEVQTQEAETVA